MSTLLAIHSYAGVNNRLPWLWPFYKKPGWDILGVGRTNAKCVWPEPVMTVDIGEDPQVEWVSHQSPNLCHRLVDTFAYFLTMPGYDDCCVIEWDSIFLKPPPPHPGGLVTTLAGGHMPGFESPWVFHCPWWADRETAARIVDVGNRLLAQGRYEKGTPDIFLGLAVSEGSIRWSASHTFSVNTIDNERYVRAAKAAIDGGAWFVHGVKTKKHLLSILPDHKFEPHHEHIEITRRNSNRASRRQGKTLAQLHQTLRAGV